MNNNNNFLLHLGSGFCLLIMTALASLLVTDCYSFIKKYPKNCEYQGYGYSHWFKQTTELSIYGFF